MVIQFFQNRVFFVRAVIIKTIQQRTTKVFRHNRQHLSSNDNKQNNEKKY